MEIMFDFERKEEEIFIASEEHYFDAQAVRTTLFNSFCDFISLDFADIIAIVDDRHRHTENEKGEDEVNDEVEISDRFDDDIKEYVVSIHPYFNTDYFLSDLYEGKCTMSECLDIVQIIKEYVDRANIDPLLYSKYAFTHFARSVFDRPIPVPYEIDIDSYNSNMNAIRYEATDNWPDNALFKRLDEIGYDNLCFNILEFLDKIRELTYFAINKTRTKWRVQLEEILIERLTKNPKIDINALFDDIELTNDPDNCFMDFELFYENIINQLSSSPNYVVVYECTDLFDWCSSSIIEIIKHGYKVKKCANCGSYFVPLNRSDAIYCDRTSPQAPDKTCKEYGAYRQHQNNLKRDKTARLYRKIYMQKQMLSKRNPDIEAYTTDFDDYKTATKQRKAEIKKGLKTSEEFYAWLKNLRRKDDDD